MPVDIDFAGDLSCTKVNAVSRLRDGLEAGCRPSGEAALPGAAKPPSQHALCWGLGPDCPDCVLGELVVGQVGQNRDAALQTGTGFEQVKLSGLKKEENILPQGQQYFWREREERQYENRGFLCLVGCFCCHSGLSQTLHPLHYCFKCAHTAILAISSFSFS